MLTSVCYLETTVSECKPCTKPEIKATSSDKSLETGDLVEFKNGVSSDWGVYLGDETVAHLTMDKHKRVSKKISSKSSLYSNNHRASKVHFGDVFVVARDNDIERNNFLDTELTPLPRSEIMMRVADCLCDGDILHFQNSKEFVIWCRYGDSPTTVNGHSTLLYFNIFTLFLCIVLLVSCLSYCAFRTFSATPVWQLTLLGYYPNSSHLVNDHHR